MNKYLTKQNFAFGVFFFAVVLTYLVINEEIKTDFLGSLTSKTKVSENEDEVDSNGVPFSESPVFQLSKENQIRWLNVMRPKQNDPVLLQIVRKYFLIPPSGLPFTGTYGPNDYSGQPPVDLLLNLTQKKQNGFFFDSSPGTDSAIPKSSTVYLERVMNWTGLIIEPNPSMAQELIQVQRNVWKANVCISPVPYPIEMIYRVEGHKVPNNTTPTETFNITQQCLPIGTLLLAINKSITVDYLNLGPAKNTAEQYYTFHTLPFDKVHIKAIKIGLGESDLPASDTRLTQINAPLRGKGFQNYTEIGGAKDYLLYTNIKQRTRTTGSPSPVEEQEDGGSKPEP